MEPFTLHVFICTQEKPAGAPGCSASGSGAVLERLRAELAANRLDESVQVTTCGSLGLCTRGPNMVVYPEGVWYSAVQPADVEEIVREHFLGGRVVARLANADPVALRAEILENRRRYLASLKAQQERAG